MHKDSTYNCSQCGSDLILVSKVTEILEGYLFPLTTSTYRCTNDECQQQKDRQAEKLMKLQKEKANAIQIRLKEKLREKKLLAKALIFDK